MHAGLQIRYPMGKIISLIWGEVEAYNYLCIFTFSCGRRPYVFGVCGCWFTSAHLEQHNKSSEQRQFESSVWITWTSVDVGGTDWTTDQHQSTGLYWRPTRWHSTVNWTSRDALSCPVWIRSRQNSCWYRKQKCIYMCHRRTAQTSIHDKVELNWNSDARSARIGTPQFSFSFLRYPQLLDISFIAKCIQTLWNE